MTTVTLIMDILFTNSIYIKKIIIKMLYLINNISGEDRPVTVSYHGKSIPTQNLLQQNIYILK